MVDKRTIPTSIEMSAKRICGSTSPSVGGHSRPSHPDLSSAGAGSSSQRPIEVGSADCSAGSSLSKGKSRAVPLEADSNQSNDSPDVTMKGEMAANIKRLLDGQSAMLARQERLETQLQDFMQKDKVSTVSVDPFELADR